MSYGNLTLCKTRDRRKVRFALAPLGASNGLAGKPVHRAYTTPSRNMGLRAGFDVDKALAPPSRTGNPARAGAPQVRLLDLNLLVYAMDESSARHNRARRWLDQTLSGSERHGLERHDRFPAALHTVFDRCRLSPVSRACAGSIHGVSAQ